MLRLTLPELVLEDAASREGGDLILGGPSHRAVPARHHLRRQETSVTARPKCGVACLRMADLQLHRPRGILEQRHGLRVTHPLGGASADADDAISDLGERDNRLG